MYTEFNVNLFYAGERINIMSDDEFTGSNKEDVIEYEIEEGQQLTCTIIKTEKRGIYWYATARCTNGTTKTRGSSNINVAKGLACQACG